MDVAVLGATGDVGRQVCTQLVERALLPPTSRLQLVGRAGGASARATYGLRADLIDAYDEHAPIIDVALDPADVVADIVVMAAGRTHPSDAPTADRSELAADNAAVFHAYADALAEHGSGSEVVVVVTNPVELGVAILADRLGRERVVGMGAWLDTLRFRREVAVSLGVRRHRVGGFVGGEHGSGAVPLWSTVRVGGLEVAERERAVARVRGPRGLDDFPAEVAAAQRHLATLDTAEGFRWVDTLPPDLRVVVRPYLTHRSGAKTAAGTANATIDLIDTILDGRDIVVAGQVALAGEVSLGGAPVHGVLGVPVVLGPEGWTRVMLDEPAPDEERMLAAVSSSVAAAMGPWTEGRASAGSAVPAPDEPDAGDDARWVALVEADDTTGTIAALAGVFASRGVSIGSLATGHERGSAGQVVVTFRAGVRQARLLTRTLERLPMVRGLAVRPAATADEPLGSPTPT